MGIEFITIHSSWVVGHPFHNPRNGRVPVIRLAGTQTVIARLGTFAIVLAAIGLYGILAYFITGRRREIGLRMALGALPFHIGNLLVKQLVPIVGIGLAVYK